MRQNYSIKMYNYTVSTYSTTLSSPICIQLIHGGPAEEALDRESSSDNQTRLQATKSMAQDQQLPHFHINGQALEDLADKRQIAIKLVYDAIHCDGEGSDFFQSRDGHLDVRGVGGLQGQLEGVLGGSHV